MSAAGEGDLRALAEWSGFDPISVQHFVLRTRRPVCPTKMLILSVTMPSTQELGAATSMKRREFFGFIGVALAAWPGVARAQRAQKAPMIGFLHPGSPEVGSVVLDSLREGFREHGYIEGVSIKVEARWARGKPEALPQLTQELIQLGVDVLVPTARPSIEASRAATTTLPIVANDLESDPIASGYVASLARPGGNLTGVFLDAPTLCSKWFNISTTLCRM